MIWASALPKDKKGIRINTKPLQIRSFSSTSNLINPKVRLFSSYTSDEIITTITKKEKIQINEIINSVKETELFKTAFTHKSCRANNIPLKSYETLEFYGDSILSYYTAKFLYTVYPDYNEGDMTKLRSLLVGTNNLSVLSKNIELDKYLNFSTSLPENIKINILNKDKTFADIFESFVATLYLEKGEDILLKFLGLTIFNSSKTKNKREEFKKLNDNIHTNLTDQIPFTINNKHSEDTSYVEKEKAMFTNNELFKENSKDLVIPLDLKSMNKITFKFEDLKTKEDPTLLTSIESLLYKNHIFIIKELIKLQTIQDQILDKNSDIQKELNININNELKSNLHTLNELKNIDLNQKNILKQVENINIQIKEFEINRLELNNKLNIIQFILYILLAVLFIITI